MSGVPSSRICNAPDRSAQAVGPLAPTCNTEAGGLPPQKRIKVMCSHDSDRLESGDRKSSFGNDGLADVLAEMGAVHRVKRDIFRARAYERAAEALCAHPQQILTGGQARAIRGIGDGIARRIDVLLEKGELEQLAELKRDDDVIALRELRIVHGVGAIRAAELMERGIHSLDMLRSAVADGHVRLDASQSVGLRYVSDLQKRIPRSEMVQHEELLKRVCSEKHPELVLMVCGSYRRGKIMSGDIDVLITCLEFTSSLASVCCALIRSFVQSLSESQYLVADLAAGDKKYTGVCKLPGAGQFHRRIDIRCIPSDCFHFGTLYFTGSATTNVRMRLRALELGLTLNEYGLERRSTGERLHLASEREVFEKLGLDYLEPTER